MNRFYYSILLYLCCTNAYAQVHTDSCQHRPSSILTDSIWNLSEIEVVSRRIGKSITGMMEGKLELQMDALKSLPQFLGTADALRTMRLMPGVQTTGEANSGLYIRGGEPSHNLLLLNGAPIYNPMHLMGFFSAFNSGHLNKATLFKSYISPEYGGRLGGILSIQTKDSVSRRLTAEGNIGLIASQGTLSIPVTPKSSLYLSLRATYLNPLLKIVNSAQDDVSLKYDFQDYNLTYVYAPSKHSKIILNGYLGSDDLIVDDHAFQINAQLGWTNIASSLQWQQIISENSQLEQTLYFSSFKNNIDMALSNAIIRLPSDMKDLGYKGHYSFNAFRCYWTIGADYVLHLARPQSPQTDQIYNTASSPPTQHYKTHETGIYIDCTSRLNDHLTARLGLRYSNLFHTGSYEEKQVDDLGYETQTNAYSNGQLVKYYGGLEPRFSLEYSMSNNHKLFLSYGLQRQYQNQVAVSTLSFPIDFWVPASKNILPQSAHSFSASYFCSFLNDKFEFSVEGYFKRLKNQLEFDGGLFDMINQQYNMENKLLTGTGYTYGGEWLIKKNKGRLTGWIGYTLGWSKRQFPTINSGKAFSAKHDRRHDLSVVANYRINEKWDCSAVFVYATGNAFTMPVAMYVIGENPVSEYGPYNQTRMPAYHRLDLSVNYWFKRSVTRESGLNFSIYNAYARQNPIYLGYSANVNEEDKTISIKKKNTSLYSLIPSISYTFKF